jgi:hypothetical protein
MLVTLEYIRSVSFPYSVRYYGVLCSLCIELNNGRFKRQRVRSASERNRRFEA